MRYWAGARLPCPGPPKTHLVRVGGSQLLCCGSDVIEANEIRSLLNAHCLSQLDALQRSLAHSVHARTLRLEQSMALFVR